MEEATAMMSNHDWRRVGAVYSARRRGCGSGSITYLGIFRGFKPKKGNPLGINAMGDYVDIYSERRKFRMTGQPRIQRTVWQWQERMA